MFITVLGFDEDDIRKAIYDEYDMYIEITKGEFQEIVQDLQVKLANNDDFNQIVTDTLAQSIGDLIQ
jgi:hypothetical protein